MLRIPNPNKDLNLSPIERFLPLWDFVVSSGMGIILTVLCSMIMVSGFETLHHNQVDKYFKSLLNVMSLTLSHEERLAISAEEDTPETLALIERVKKRSHLILEIDRRVAILSLIRPHGSSVEYLYEVTDVPEYKVESYRSVALDSISLRAYRIRDSVRQYPYETSRGKFYAVSVPVFDSEGAHAIGAYTLKVPYSVYIQALRDVRKRFILSLTLGVLVTLIFAAFNYLARIYFIAVMREPKRRAEALLQDGDNSEAPTWEELRQRLEKASGRGTSGGDDG